MDGQHTSVCVHEQGTGPQAATGRGGADRRGPGRVA